MFYLVKYSVYSMPNENNSSISKLICMLIPALCAFNQNVQEKTTPQNIRDVQSLLPLVLSLRTTEKSLPSSSLLPPMRYLYTLIRSPEPFLLQGEQSWPSASPRKTDAQSPQSPLWWPYWSHSSVSMSPLCWGTHNWTQHSRWPHLCCESALMARNGFVVSNSSRRQAGRAQGTLPTESE